jgi:hypothetical protein
LNELFCEICAPTNIEVFLLQIMGNSWKLVVGVSDRLKLNSLKLEADAWMNKFHHRERFLRQSYCLDQLKIILKGKLH